jgi:hypothetical protein
MVHNKSLVQSLIGRGHGSLKVAPPYGLDVSLTVRSLKLIPLSLLKHSFKNNSRPYHMTLPRSHALGRIAAADRAAHEAV